MVPATSHETLSVIPADTRDLGTQRCRLGPQMINKLGTRLAGHVKISDGRKSCICCVFARRDLCEGFLQFDQTVTIDENTTGDKTSAVRPPVIETLHTTKCNSVKISIVTDTLDGVKQYRKLLKHDRGKVEELCRNCLLNVCVSDDVIVDLRNNEVSKLYKFTYILVESISCALPLETKAEHSSQVYGIIVPATIITVRRVMSSERYHYLRHEKEQHLELGGLNRELAELCAIVKSLSIHSSNPNVCDVLPHGILLTGPPGCGKTTLVRHVARKCDAFLVTISGAEIFGPYPGQSEENLRNVFNKAVDMSTEGICILFIDEIDALCAKRGTGAHEDRVTSTVLQFFDDPRTRNLLVIGATNLPGSLDPALRRPGRFDREVIITVPTLTQRRQILHTITTRLPLSPTVDIDELARCTNGYVGADLVLFAQEAGYAALEEGRCIDAAGDANMVPEISPRHFQTALQKITPSTQRGSDAVVDLTPVQWVDIGGLAEVKVKVQQAVEWPMSHPEAFRRLGVPCPKGILLYGPPGCCKTTLVRAAATACGATFLAASGAQIYSPMLGDSEKAITELFHRARMGNPSILFLDEIDSIVGKRSDSNQNRGVQERLLSTLLNEMDGVGIRLDVKSTNQNAVMLEEGLNSTTDIKQSHGNVDNSGVLVVAATNRPDLVDDALLRPGRFDRHIYVPPPDMQGRLAILSVKTRSLPMVDVDLHMLAEQTPYYTGADLDNLCREAALLALTQDGFDSAVVTHRHFDEILSHTSASLNEHTILYYKQLKH